MIKRLCSKSILKAAAALAIGMLMVGAFAPFYIYPLAILVPTLLLALIMHASPKQAFWLGFMFGLGYFGAGVYWIFISIHQYGDVPNLIAASITLLTVAILAVFPAMCCYFLSRYYPTNHITKYICAFPAIWITSEWVRSWFVCGFAWLFIGYSQTNSPLRGYAPILSVYLVTLMALISSGLLLDSIIKYRTKCFEGMYKNLFAFAAIWITGALLSLIPWTEAKGNAITVSLVQGNIPQSIKWMPEYIQLSLKRYEQLTAPLWGKSDIIVWPESAVPMEIEQVSQYIDRLDNRARTSGSDLIFGVPIENIHGGGYFNAMVSLGKDRSFYLKRRLVPYGEYVPFQWISSKILNFMNVPMSNMVPGGYDQAPMEINGVKINTSICFEVTFPELISTNDSSIGLLLTTTNDAWFGKSTAKAQHLQMAAMRAIELGRPVLFASNDGISAFIGPHGEIEAQAPTNEPYVLTRKVQPMQGLTPWMTNRMDPLLVIVISLLYFARRQEKRSTELTKDKATAVIKN